MSSSCYTVNTTKETRFEINKDVILLNIAKLVAQVLNQMLFHSLLVTSSNRAIISLVYFLAFQFTRYFASSGFTRSTCNRRFSS